LHRAKERERLATGALAVFKRNEDIEAPESKRQFAKLEQELAEASADAAYAADRLMEVAA
jgi:hypothetical protein